MGTRILMSFLAALGTLLSAGSPQSKENGGMMTGKAASTGFGARGHAQARISVQNSEAKPYDQRAGPAFVEVHLNETFTGDIEGESPVRALEVLRDDKSATLVSQGKLGGRQGSFVLQGQEVVENGKIRAKWFVVPGSGTGDLSGLRGEGGFEGDFGKGSHGMV